MKNLLLILTIILPLFSSAANYDDSVSPNKESTKLSLYVPGILIKAGSLFVNKKDPETKQAIAHLRSTSICIREGAAYHEMRNDKKVQRRFTKLQSGNYDPLISVNSSAEKVAVSIHQNKQGTIKQVVLLCDDGEESFVYLKVRCRFTDEMLKCFLSKATAHHSALTQTCSIP